MWTAEIPTVPGHYWFYGDPYKGQMGIDFRDDCPPIEPKMYLVNVNKISNGLMAVTEGNFISLNKFDKTGARFGHQGVVGYWRNAELPTSPWDDNKLFK